MDNIDKYLKQIEKNFPYMKFELEANFDNMTDDDCDECNGSGERYNYENEEYDNCDYCSGAGTYEGLTDYMLSELPNFVTKHITYGNAYNDSSVNTEYTFTIATQAVKHLPLIIRTFLSYAEGYNTENAGFHISVLSDKEGVYPCNSVLDLNKIYNFINSTSRLMPALIYSATPDKLTRKFYYRMPQVSTDKYSAIHLLKGGIEYRLFDPCYNQPEKVFDYIKIIANTLKFYSKRKLKSKLYDKFELETKYVDTDTNLDSIFNIPTNLDALRRTLPYVDPDKIVKIKVRDDNKIKYQNLRKAVKAYQNHLEQRQLDIERYLKQDFLSYKKGKMQAELLKDLDKITARQYLDIQDNRRNMPYYLEGIEVQSNEDLVRRIKNYRNQEMYETSLDYFIERYNRPTSKITITG